MSVFTTAWHSFEPSQRRNIMIYIAGIMMYKMGLEFFNGSITTLATDRFRAANTFTKLGAAQAVNQAMQCVGAILIAPLAKSFHTRTVLAWAVWMFALMTTILLIVDAATGGSIKAVGGKVDYGNWDPNAIFPIWGIAGIAYGMVELIRRVIPADICGGDVSRLRRMDATVHILYEVAGTSGAFASSAAISRFGNNYSYMLTPIFFALAGIAWYFITPTRAGQSIKDTETPALAAVERQNRGATGYLAGIARGTYLFFKSGYIGGKIIFTNRKFCWLFTSYALALYLHRFLESSLAPAFARRVLGTSAWSQIIVGGSNFGELLGALTVFLLVDAVSTPLPWLRLDALALNVVWVLPTFAEIATREVKWAWITAACFLPISFGWAAGDVSLAAYVQSNVSDMDIGDSGISPLGAVMSFLYSSYIVFNAIFSVVLGRVIDRDFVANGNIVSSLRRVGGVQFSICCGIILLSTLIPRGAFALNPAGTFHKANDTEAGGLTGYGLEKDDDQKPTRSDSGDIDNEDLKPVQA